MGYAYGAPVQSVSHKKPQKLRKTKNGQESHLFPILLTIATKQKHLQPYNLAILVEKAFFKLFVVTKSSLIQYLRCFSPNNEAILGWRRFFVLLAVSGSAAAVYPPNSGYPSAELPYFDFELRFLVAAAT